MGIYGLQTVIQTLDRDWEDEEITAECLELLTLICTTRSPAKSNPNAKEFAEIFLKDEGNVALLMRILSSGDGGPQMKFVLLSLLAGLTELCARRMKELMGRIPNAISDVVGLLGESAEYLQTEALGLLIGLAEGDYEVQKMIAFEGGLERLPQMALESGGLEAGGPVVEEALHLLFVLLNDNPSNQKLFSESGFLLRLQELLSSDQMDYDERATVHLMRILGCLVDRGSSKGAQSVQGLLVNTPGLIDPIIKLALSGATEQVATEALLTLAATMKYNPPVQDIVSSMQFEKEPLISCLIRAALNPDHSLPRRMAAVQAFEEMIEGNERVKLAIVSTFTPPPPSEEDDEIAESAGSLIINGLYTSFTFTATHLLSALLADSPDCKHMAMNYLVTEEEEGSMNLFQALIFTLLSSSKEESIEATLGLLGLFSIWIHEFPPSAHQFLENGSTVHLLLELIEQHHQQAIGRQGLAAFLLAICAVTSQSDDLRALIHNRIGAEIFAHRIRRFSDHINDYCLDHFFRRFFQLNLEKVLSVILTPLGTSPNPQLDAVKANYEQLLAERDAQIAYLQQSLASFEQTMTDWRELRLKASQLESALMSKEQELAFARRAVPSDVGEVLAEKDRLRRQVDAYVAQMLAVEAENEELLRQLAVYESNGQPQVSPPLPTTSPVKIEEIELVHEQHTPVKSVANFASGAFAKLQHSSLVTKIASSTNITHSPTPASTTTFDV